MRRLLIVPLVLLAAITVAPSPAYADGPPRFQITTSISLTMVDERLSPLPDTNCVITGTTSQVTDQTNATLRLGTGTPGVDYPANRGPFRDTLTNAILFVCGEASVCFPSASAMVEPDATASANIPVSYHVGGTTPCLNSTRVGFQRIGAITAPGGGRVCVSAPPLAGLGLDRIQVSSFCLTSVRLAPQLTITGFGCDSLDSQYTCAVGFRDNNGAVTIDWFLNGSQTPSPTLTNLTSFTRRCAPGYGVRVRVRLSDNSGRVVERSAGFRCLGDDEEP